MKALALVLAAAGLVAPGCASTAGQPWKDIQVGMSDEAAMALGVKPCAIAKGDEGAIVMNYADGGSVTMARGDDGEWRVASIRRP